MFSSIVLTVFASILIVQLSDAFHVSHTTTSIKVSRSAAVKMSDNKAESSLMRCEVVQSEFENYVFTFRILRALP